ncbi:hypothetical protein WMF11_35325 [Sorangium sp. So ce295]|uniref:hypothetical protein n=1 Tax=Sorangium sp. So ce295 TaxID=3133295 RepID=UPI003F604361
MTCPLPRALCAGFVAMFLFGCADEGSGDEQVVAQEPNKDVPYRGVDGEFTSDPLAAACPEDPRNPGRIVFKQMTDFSFYSDREGQTPLAEGCTYSYGGFAPDPHYFPEYPESVWLQFELASGDAACEAFHFVVMRPPHGDGDVKHMHLRYGGADSGFAALLDMSNDAEDADKCNPWWSAYCTAGIEGCDG